MINKSFLTVQENLLTWPHNKFHGTLRLSFLFFSIYYYERERKKENKDESESAEILLEINKTRPDPRANTLFPPPDRPPVRPPARSLGVREGVRGTTSGWHNRRRKHRPIMKPDVSWEIIDGFLNVSQHLGGFMASFIDKMQDNCNRRRQTAHMSERITDTKSATERIIIKAELMTFG